MNVLREKSSTEEEFVLWELDESGYPTRAVASFLSLDRAKHYATEVLRIDIIITKNALEEDLSDYKYDPDDLVWTSPWIYN